MPWQKIKALREERAKLSADMQAILDKADSEKRDLSADEEGKFGEMNKRAEAALKELGRYESVAQIGAAATGGQAIRQLDSNHAAANPIFEQRDLKEYSLLRALRCAMSGRPVDGLEGEVSQEIAKRSGKSPQGFYFPTEIAVQSADQRSLTLTTGSGAKPTITDASNFIELLRNRQVMAGLGARYLTGLTGDLSIPKQTGGATAYWVAEGSAPTASNQTIGSVALAPKTVGAYTDISRKFILQSSVSAEQFVRQDLATVLAIELDRAAINGSGSGAEPTGILNTGSIGSVAIGTNGGAPTWASIVGLESAVAVSNADVGALGYLTNAKVRGKLKTTPKVSGYPTYIWGDNGMVNGYNVGVSNTVPATLSKGTSSGTLSAMIFGNFNDAIYGLWSGLDILVDPYTGSSTGTVRVVALQDADFKVRHAESFAADVDYDPT